MRALGRGGIPSFLASLGQSHITSSRWYRPAPNATEDYPSPSELGDFLESLPFARAVLMPCADDWVPAVASLRPSLRDRFPASVADAGVIQTLMDKGRLATELERLGLPHPRTVPVGSAEELSALPDVLFENAFLKPRDSLGFQRRYGRKIVPVKDREDAKRLFTDFENDGYRVVLQEWISGAVSDHYFIEGFVDRRGRIRARFARQRLRVFPPEFGQSTYTVSIPLEEVAEASGTLESLFSAVPYRGVFNVEFVRDPRDGVFRLLEVNVRPYIHIEFAAQCGVDLTRMAYEDALGHAVESVDEYATGRRNVDMYGDVLALIGLKRSDQVTVRSWLRSWAGADGLIFAWDDPGPALRRMLDFGAIELLRARRMRAHP